MVWKLYLWFLDISIQCFAIRGANPRGHKPWKCTTTLLVYSYWLRRQCVSIGAGAWKVSAGSIPATPTNHIWGFFSSSDWHALSVREHRQCLRGKWLEPVRFRHTPQPFYVYHKFHFLPMVREHSRVLGRKVNVGSIPMRPTNCLWVVS